jgi:PTH1 family peptidyl-tRNA hydrolase
MRPPARAKRASPAPRRASVRLFRRGERASSLDLLVAGLGNPGREYAGHRHSVGFMVADELARRHGGSWRSKFAGELAELRIGDARVAMVKPLTYMNESGRSVGAAARFFKVPPEQLLVVHDEGDFDLGRLQVRLGGGLAGHNGLRSVAQALGSKEFLRLRIGVGRPGRGDPRELADYVLSDFEPEDDAERIVARAADAVETILRDGLEATQREFHAS